MDNRLVMDTQPVGDFMPTITAGGDIPISPELEFAFSDMPGDSMESLTDNLTNIASAEKPAQNIHPEGKEFTEEDLVKFYVDIKKEADDKRKPYEDEWSELWDMYNGNDDFTGKANWQSQEVIPRTFTMAENVASMFKRALMTIPDWFSITKTFHTDDPILTAKINLASKLVKYFLEKNEYPFIFGRTVKSGLLSYLLVNKVTWSYPGDLLSDESKFKNGGCVIEMCSPFNIWLDWTGRDKFIIHRTTLDYGDFIYSDKNGKSLFVNVDKVNSDYTDFTADSEENERKEMPAGVTASRKEIQLEEYWGDVYHTDGKLVYKNCMFIIANGKTIVKKPIENPNKHKKKPFVVCGSIDVPFGVYHKSILGVNKGLFKLITELANQTIDSNNFSILKNFAVNKDAMADPSIIDDGIFPGKIWETNNDTQDSNPVKLLDFGQPPQSIFTLMQLVDREIQSSGVTEYVTGLPRMKGRPTATEVTQKLAQSNSLFDTLARDIEYHFLTPLVRMIYETIVQNLEYIKLDEEFLSAVPEARALLGTNPEDRYKELAGDFVITVSGLSIVLNRQSEIEKIVTLIKLLSGNQEMIAQLDWNKISGKVLEALNWTADDILLSPDKAAMQQQRMMLQQMAQSGQLNNQVIPGQPPQELSSGQVIPGQPPQVVPPPVMNPQMMQQMFNQQGGMR
jgi:hypothetical protein